MLKAAPMPPVAPSEPDRGTPCRNCGQALPSGKSVCTSCGAAQGEGNRCPHCNAVADVAPHPALGFRCLVCGGPRVALDSADVSLSARTNQALANAGTEQTKHLMFSAAGYFLSGMGGLALVLAAVVELTVSPGVAATVAAYLAAAVPFGAGLFSLASARAARKRRTEALRVAQVHALSDVQAVKGALSAASAAQLMRISPERAELLLAEASVASMLEEVPAARLRIEAPAPTSPGPTELQAPETELSELEPPGKTVRGDTEI
jgi:hypothetical protein